MTKKMKAARWYGPAEPLRLETVPEPILRPGAVKVRVLATFVSPSLRQFLSNPSETYPLPPPPFTPGMSIIGVIEESLTAGLDVGTRVYCDPYLAPANPASSQAGAFMAYFGFAATAAPLLATWPDGGFAEKVLVPAECITPLGPASTIDAHILVRTGHLATAYAALNRAEFRSGDRIIVTGATGVLGLSAVMVAIAMGASGVAVIGRRKEVLDRIVALSPKRIKAFDTLTALTRDFSDADSMIDCASAGNTENLAAAIGALKVGGTAVLLRSGTELPRDHADLVLREITLRGSMWFPRRVPGALFALIGSGALDLSSIRAKQFKLDAVNDALAFAASAQDRTGFDHVALVP